ncbi:MAG: hypothetical protein HRT35_33425 [Algicola sp.]|nr:hypothetical protein [Algicola sp.]
MNRLNLLPLNLIRTALFCGLISAPNVMAHTDHQPTNKNYDAALAKKLGADERGMRGFVHVVLKTGPNDAKITDKAERKRLFAGHFANMARLAKAGKLLVSGPFFEGKPMRGLLIFNVATLKEAESLIKTDPTVEAGIFVYEMTKLYGPAGLVQMNEIQGKLRKDK